MDLNTFFQLLNNAELLVSLSVLYQITNYLEDKLKRNLVVLNGFLLGSIGIILMSTPVRLTNGTLFDTRSILIGLVGLIFSAIPAFIAATMMIIYRIYLGGSGTIMGVMVITFSCLIGLSWKRISAFLKVKNKWFGLLLMGIVIHGVMLGCTVFLPEAIRLNTLKTIFVPVITIYPLATVVVGKLLQLQQELSDNNRRIKEGELKFHSIFDQAKIGIGYAGLNGKLMDLNQMFCDLLGYTHDELTQKTLNDFTYPEDLSIDDDLMKELKKGKIPNFSIDKRYIKKDGSVLWVNLTVSLVEFEKGRESYVMCAIVDINERKTAEEYMLYLSTHDQQTNLFNRRYFEEKIKEIDALLNYPLSIILVNVNGLKLINDAYGYKTGDVLLRKVVRILEAKCTDSSLMARVSGSEFAVVSMWMNKERTNTLLQELRKAFLEESIENIHLSVSGGYAVKTDENENIADTYKRAKDRLNKENLIDKTSMASRTIDIIMNSLFEKNSREMLHSKRVSQLCEFIARHMKLDETEINKIKIAGLMHDIGKIGINDQILNKSGKLTTDEWNDVRSHSEVGYRILSSANEFSEIAEYILSHHERWDGTGYPQGLKGEEIHVYARIIAVADSFDAMTSERTYRTAMTIREAIEEIRKNALTQFDPRIAEVFIKGLLEE
jgi:PAS domain S-box-containing protein/diguanylate cyclase (GGDEF)-like protein/putative nucleotidyltransferase with HDIG domain